MDLGHWVRRSVTLYEGLVDRDRSSPRRTVEVVGSLYARLSVTESRVAAASYIMQLPRMCVECRMWSCTTCVFCTLAAAVMFQLYQVFLRRQIKENNGSEKMTLKTGHCSISRTDYMFGPGPFDMLTHYFAVIHFLAATAKRSSAIHHEGTQYT